MNENYTPQGDFNEEQGKDSSNSTPNYTSPPQQPPSSAENPENGSYQPYYTNAPTPPAYRPPEQQYSTSSGWQRPNHDPRRRYDNSVQGEMAEDSRKKHTGMRILGAILASLLTVSVLVFAGIGVMNVVNRPSSSSDVPATDPTLQVPASDLPSITLQNKPETTEEPLPEGKLTTEQIVKKVEPSVVAITTYLNVQNYQASGMGSGIVISADGYIVTNAHVVESAKGITVQMSNGDSYEGRLIAADSKTDLAVLKVDATGLTPAEFGNSEEVQVGEQVLAIGNPQSMDFYGSVTQGIVSGLNRKVSAQSQAGGSVTNYSNLIQTDAAINPGNSGGALVNEYGQVIGINSAKVVTTGAEGMGFAIPMNEAKPVIDDLIANGYVTNRVRLGITTSVVDEALARLNSVPTGLFVQATEEGSDISKQGVIPGDIITKINDKEIISFESLSDELKEKKPGDTVTLEVYRRATRSGEQGRFFEITVMLLEDRGQTGTLTPSTTDSQQTPDYSRQYPDNSDQYSDSNDALEDFFNQFFN